MAPLRWMLPIRPPLARRFVAYTEKSRVNGADREHRRYTFGDLDDGVAVGSPDPGMSSLAAALHDEFGTPYEVQMRMGMRTQAQDDLAEDVDVWQYAPYGSEWRAYFWRRVGERTANALFAIRAVAGSVVGRL